MDPSSSSWGLRSGKKSTSFSKNGSLKNCSKKRQNEEKKYEGGSQHFARVDGVISSLVILGNKVSSIKKGRQNIGSLQYQDCSANPLGVTCLWSHGV